MKINFQKLPPYIPTQHELEEHVKFLSTPVWDNKPRPGIVGNSIPPEGYEDFITVDVFGPEFVWMNNTFPKDKFTWYLWFESVFLVPKDMATFLILRWA